MGGPLAAAVLMLAVSAAAQTVNPPPSAAQATAAPAPSATVPAAPTPFRPPVFAAAAAAPPPQLLASVFYNAGDSKGIESFREYAAKVGIVAPQCYSLDRWGWLHGAPTPALMAIARAHGVPVMPLIINKDFSRWQAHDLLYDREARDRALGQMITHARANGFIGYQIDFEGMRYTDRAAFSRFIGELARGLHRHGLILSVAVAARTGPARDHSFDGYSGVYDYRRLAQAADFLSVMAYPEYNGNNPGPLAGYPWVQQVVQYELRFIPPEKFSLGIPTYQTDWTRRRYRVSWLRRVGRELRRFYYWTYHLFASDGQANTDGPLRWDPVLKASYRVYGHGADRHVTWVADARSFAAKLQLIRQYHLRGFSVWRLGLEDPHMWRLLPATANPDAGAEYLASMRRLRAPSVANRFAPVGARAFPGTPRRIIHSYVVRRYAVRRRYVARRRYVPRRRLTPAQRIYQRRLAERREQAERRRLAHDAAARAAAHRRYLERLRARRRELARDAAHQTADRR